MHRLAIFKHKTDAADALLAYFRATDSTKHTMLRLAQTSYLNADPRAARKRAQQSLLRIRRQRPALPTHSNQGE